MKGLQLRTLTKVPRNDKHKLVIDVFRTLNLVRTMVALLRAKNEPNNLKYIFNCVRERNLNVFLSSILVYIFLKLAYERLYIVLLLIGE